MGWKDGTPVDTPDKQPGWKSGTPVANAKDGGDSSFLGGIAKYGEESTPLSLLPVHYRGGVHDPKNAEWGVPGVIAAPVGVVARNMQDVGRMVAGEQIPPEQLKRDAAGMAGVLAGGAETDASGNFYIVP